MPEKVVSIKWLKKYCKEHEIRSYSPPYVYIDDLLSAAKKESERK